VVHAVHHPVSVRTEVVRSLEDPGQDIKHLFGGLTHRKSPVCGVAVEKESLEKEGEVPVSDKKRQDYKHDGFAVKVNKIRLSGAQ